VNYRIIPVCIPNSSNNIQDKDAYATGWGGIYVKITKYFA